MFGADVFDADVFDVGVFNVGVFGVRAGAGEACAEDVSVLRFAIGEVRCPA
ncbi:hypothetical protein [Methylobacterium sp. Leaf117]|uniref:hypothetical protein n=1 Tax=Methylobacterium sp. Leaf117 TaxID=1736260 RepID=UPI0012E1D294|nr:hypothetical protein [Methylobacterium sp. Leaf117]